MKSVFHLTLILSFFIVLASCKSNTGTNNATSKTNILSEKPMIKFETDMHDFGEVVDGEKVSFTFKFTNAGKGPLLITGCNSSCGCTVAEYTHDTVKSGGHGEVTVSFDSWKRVGFQEKSVTVNTNEDTKIQMLHIKAMVIPTNLNNK